MLVRTQKSMQKKETIEIVNAINLFSIRVDFWPHTNIN
jgi:hypothetical protein